MTTSHEELVDLKNKLINEGEIVRTKDSVVFNENQFESANDDEDETCLFRLEKMGGNYTVVPLNSNEPNDRLWVVIRSLKEGYIIKKHDIIKLGRMKFRVKEFRTENEYFEDLNNDTSPHPGFDENYVVDK
mmetsp:Transcript_25048/g.27772  ORF Transcript_25048/g.27772 Transcript_25048/m.27772 type:complete len:131 (+) Transcript_25048:132-524(+)